MFKGDFHQWKVVSLYGIKKHVSKKNQFHSNLDSNASLYKVFSSFYQEILIH